jgi:hypothetical protein
MALFFVGLLLGVLLGWLTLGCFLNPGLGRLCVRLFAVVALSIGLGFLVWAIVGQALGQRIHNFLGTDLITQSSDAIAFGSGALAAGIAALVLSFVGRKKPAARPPEPEAPSPP